MSKLEEKEYPDYDLKICDKECIVINSNSDKVNIRSDNKEIKLKDK